MWSAISDWFGHAATMVAAFFSGMMTEKYRDAKKENAVQRRRDGVDAERVSLPADILERMRRNKL
jgi:hypothetical protein